MPDSLNSDSLNIAIAGLGTVGTGVVKIIQQNKVLLTNRSEKTINITAVSARDKSRDRGINISDYQWFDDPVAMVKDSDADIIVELIGGADGPAKAVCEAALEKGKHVVTANKALIAEHGVSLAGKAEEKNISLLFEAAVAGGIPIIKALSEGLSANKLSRICGILNGTCNYIVTEMEKNNEEFEAVLDVAQKKGFAEADPSFDIDGIDAAHKLTILTSLAFGTKPSLKTLTIEGIRSISSLDISFAKELGFKIKLLGIAENIDGKICQRVHPCLIDRNAAIAKVDGVLNAVFPEGDFVGSTAYVGPGAGSYPTASAVVADIIDVSRESKRPPFVIKTSNLQELNSFPVENRVGAYYIRLMVLDKPGVLADITAILRDFSVSLESMVQRGRSPGNLVPVVMTTHDVVEKNIMDALSKMTQLETVIEKPVYIRIEVF